MYDLSTLPTVFLHVARLPISCRPARVVRHNGMTLLWAHPGVLKAVVAMWAMDHLTTDERRSFRLAYGMDPDLSVPPDDELIAGRMSYLQDIPDLVRMPYVRKRDRQTA